MDSNVAELLSRAATQEPDKTILSEAATGRTVTCSGLDELVQRVVQGLADAGMVAGYRVMIATGNGIEFVAAYLGALRAGMVVVPVNPRSATGELIRMLADSGTRMVIADGDTITTVREAVGGLSEAMEAAGHEPATRPRIVTVGTTLAPGERGWDQLVATLGGAIAARGSTPRPWRCCSTRAAPRADRAPRCCPTARCWPTSSRWPRWSRR